MKHTATILVLLFSLVTYSFCQNPCRVCEEAIDDGCIYCDLENDVAGISWAVPNCGGCPILGSDCGVNIRNPMVFAFIAGETNIEVGIEGNCTLIANGISHFLRASLYQSCDYDSGCLATTNNGCIGDYGEFEFSGLTVGEVYYIVVTECTASMCSDFVLEIEHNAFELDLPEAIGAFSDCTNQCLTESCGESSGCTTNEISVCPGETIEFIALHDGSSSTDFGDFDAPCSSYSPDIDATFVWYVDEEEISINQLEEGRSGPSIIIPDMGESYGLEVCLSSIETPCEIIEIEACLYVDVVPPEPETYNFAVCAYDLDSFDPADADEDPNQDGVGWLGEDGFELDEVLEWEDGCETFKNVGECGCIATQTLCLDIISTIEPIETTSYLYECQFDSKGEYLWEWKDIRFDIDLSISTNDKQIVIEEGSQNADWEDISCDSSIVLTIEVAEVPGIISSPSCEGNMSEVEFSLDFRALSKSEYKEWPEISEDYLIEYINCSTAEVLHSTHSNENIPFQYAVAQQICVKASYSFFDGIWGDADNNPLAQMTSCDKVFGPYNLNNACNNNEPLQTCPSWSSFELFLDGSLLPDNGNHSFTIPADGELGITTNENLLPDEATIDWHIGLTPDFIPDTSNSSASFIGNSDVQSNWKQGEINPSLLAINFSESLSGSEYFIVGSGSGLYIDDLFIELQEDCTNNACPDNCINGIYGQVCPWVESSRNELQDCSNIIPVGPGDLIPPNSNLVIFLDDKGLATKSAQNLCSIEGCIYVLFNECERCIDAFQDFGSAAYTIYGANYSSSLSYSAAIDQSGYATYDGQYGSELDSLPKLNIIPADITSNIAYTPLDLNCSTLSQDVVYLKGYVNSPLYNDNCCDRLTPTITLNLNCDDSSTSLSWTSLGLANLPTDITITLDDSEQAYSFPSNQFEANGEVFTFPLSTLHYSSTCPGSIYFEASHTPFSTYEIGTTLVSYIVEDYCGDDLYHSFEITVECKPDSNDEIFKDYPWLNNLVDSNDCKGISIETYIRGSYTYIFIKKEGEFGILYNDEGLKYCTDRTNLSCIEAYDLTGPVNSWNCEDSEDCNCPTDLEPVCGEDGVSYDNACLAECEGIVIVSQGECEESNEQIFQDFSWLADLVNPNDCEGISIETYTRGSYTYILIKQEGEFSILYNDEGLKYCTDRTNFSCVEVYGLTGPTSIWECEEGSTNNEDQIFVEFPWLTDLVDPNDCEDQTISLYQSGIYQWLFIQRAGEFGVLYSSDGLRYCGDRTGLDCRMTYGIVEEDLIDQWECQKINIELNKRSFELDKLNIYPNPNRGVFSLKGLDYNIDRISINDNLGRKVKPNISNKQSILEIDITNEKSGLYYLTIRKEGEIKVFKVLVIK